MSASPHRTLAALLAVVATLASCGSSSDDLDAADDGSAATVTLIETTASTVVATADDASADAPTTDAPTTDAPTTDADVSSVDVSSGDVSTYLVEVWADNWSAVYVDGELVGEDSVSITTERSFNSEAFTFEATYPFTLAIEAKDFKETDSGIEYIGEGNQQMGDGGLIAQVTDAATGEVVAVTDSDWSALVVHRAPLNTECVDDPDPDATCEFEITETPVGWADADFDDSGWDAATEWDAAAVDPKGGYDDVDWDDDARFIWGSDLEVDNTILTRLTLESA